MFRNAIRSLLFTIIAGVPCIHFAFAQAPELTSINLTVQDGLAGNNVYCALQDKDGYIWFGTETGVSRYDGRRFENFYMADGIADNEVFRIDQDSQGRIWFSSFNAHLSYYQNGEFFNQSSNRLPDVRLDSYYVNFFEDSRGTVWLNTRKNAIAIDTTDKHHYFPLAELGYKGVVSFVERDGSIWAMNSTGKSELKLFEDGNYLSTPIKEATISQAQAYEEYVISKPVLLTQNNFPGSKAYLMKRFGLEPGAKKVSKFHRYDSATLWACSYNGVYRISITDGQIEHYYPDKILTHVLKDREGGFWFTTLGSGVFYVASEFNKSIRPAEDIASGMYVSALFKKGEDIWFGGAEGIVGVIKKDWQWSAIGGLVNDRSRTMVKGFENGVKPGEVFVAAEDHLFKFQGEKKVESIPASVKVLRKIGANRFVLGHSDGLIVCTYKDLNTYLENYYRWPDIFRFIQKRQGEIGHAFDKIGFTIDIEPYKKGFLYATSLGVGYINEHLEEDSSEKHEVFEQRVNDINVINDSTMVLATHGHGVYLFRHGEWSQYSQKEGLVSNISKKVIAQGDSIFWVATNSGISKISVGKDEYIRNYGRADGLLSEEVYDIVVDDDQLIAATSLGISILDVKSMDESRAAPLIHIKELVINGQVSPLETRYIQQNSNSIAFRFNGLHYKSLDQLYFEYRLIGQDDHWVNTENQEVNFGKLQAGEYEFQVRAVSVFGDKSEIVTTSFEVVRPFWQLWWFVGLIALSFVALVSYVAFAMVRANRLKAQKELEFKLRIADAERKALQSQLNPHFIFNSLNSVQSMVLTDNKEDAFDYLDKFGKLIRRVLEFSDASMIALRDELSTLELYLELENERLKNKIEYTITVEDHINLEQLIPSMIIQPYVENSIWHGIIPLKKERIGRVEVKVYGNDEELYIEVVDNGVGRKSKNNSGGMGSSIANRLARNLSDDRIGSVETEDILRNGRTMGTRVTLQITRKEYDYSFNY